ncbi:MAG: glycine zipper domain-containing protein [Opitutaceae bacterium]|nr:glycine zipper domain-containing protein [Opitutaceae bacterium]
MKLLLSLGFALAVSTAVQAQVFRQHVSGGDERRPFPAVRIGANYSHGHPHRPHFGAVTYRSPYYGGYHAAPVFRYYEGYSTYDYPYYGANDYRYYGGGRAASNGLLLGALAGGIIGHNSGDFRHNGWRGAAWGAGLGWLLGSVVDANRRPVATSYPSSPVVVQPAAVAPAPAAAPAQPITIINNYYGPATPMSGANALFGR